MSLIYNRSPLRIKLPEFNGGNITGDDAFPGSGYFTAKEDLIDVDEVYSCVFSPKFNAFSSVIAPKLITYVPSLKIFSATYYKGIYIYNPSIENDLVEEECTREDIVFSISGGRNFTIDNTGANYYEGDLFKSSLNDPFSRNGVARTSANNNIFIQMSPSVSKNVPLSYFDEDGSSPEGNISTRNYIDSELSVNVPDLNPGDYFGIYLKIVSKFNVDSKPIDYSFLNMNYKSINTSDAFIVTDFPELEVIPGKTSPSPVSSSEYYTQSISLKFNTNFSYFTNRLKLDIDNLYDNYPPFFYDYRDSEEFQ